MSQKHKKKKILAKPGKNNIMKFEIKGFSKKLHFKKEKFNMPLN